MKSKKRTFTLIEVLIVTTLFAVIGLALVSTFSSGIKIWQRVYAKDPIREVNIFFESVSRDLRNTFSYKDIKFEGESGFLSFPTILLTNSLNPLENNVAKISYFLDEQSLIKNIKNLTDINKEKDGLNKKVFDLLKVRSLSFTYYFYDSESEEFLWTDQWQSDDIPLAVTISILIGYEDKFSGFKKTISIPVGNYENYRAKKNL